MGIDLIFSSVDILYTDNRLIQATDRTIFYIFNKIKQLRLVFSIGIHLAY